MVKSEDERREEMEGRREPDRGELFSTVQYTIHGPLHYRCWISRWTWRVNFDYKDIISIQTFPFFGKSFLKIFPRRQFRKSHSQALTKAWTCLTFKQGGKALSLKILTKKVVILYSIPLESYRRLHVAVHYEPAS